MTPLLCIQEKRPFAASSMSDPAEAHHPLWSADQWYVQDGEGRLRSMEPNDPQTMPNATGFAFLTAVSAITKVTSAIDDAPHVMPALSGVHLSSAAMVDVLAGTVYLASMLASGAAASMLGLETQRLFAAMGATRASEAVFWTVRRVRLALAGALLVVCAVLINFRWRLERAWENRPPRPQRRPSSDGSEVDMTEFGPSSPAPTQPPPPDAQPSPPGHSPPSDTTPSAEHPPSLRLTAGLTAPSASPGIDMAARVFARAIIGGSRVESDVEAPSLEIDVEPPDPDIGTSASEGRALDDDDEEPTSPEPPPPPPSAPDPPPSPPDTSASDTSPGGTSRLPAPPRPPPPQSTESPAHRRSQSAPPPALNHGTLSPSSPRGTSPGGTPRLPAPPPPPPPPPPPATGAEAPGLDGTLSVSVLGPAVGLRVASIFDRIDGLDVADGQITTAQMASILEKVIRRASVGGEDDARALAVEIARAADAEDGNPDDIIRLPEFAAGLANALSTGRLAEAPVSVTDILSEISEEGELLHPSSPHSQRTRHTRPARWLHARVCRKLRGLNSRGLVARSLIELCAYYALVVGGILPAVPMMAGVALAGGFVAVAGFATPWKRVFRQQLCRAARAAPFFAVVLGTGALYMGVCLMVDEDEL